MKRFFKCLKSSKMLEKQIKTIKNNRKPIQMLKKALATPAGKQHAKPGSPDPPSTVPALATPANKQNATPETIVKPKLTSTRRFTRDWRRGNPGSQPCQATHPPTPTHLPLPHPMLLPQPPLRLPFTPAQPTHPPFTHPPHVYVCFPHGQT